MAIILVPDKQMMENIIDEQLGHIGIQAFDRMIDLKSISGCQIVIPSQMASRLNKRLTDEHKATIFSSICVDNSTQDLSYDSYTAYPQLVPIKATNSKDTVIFIAHDVNMYAIPSKRNIVQITSSAFVERAKCLLDFARKVRLDFYDEIIISMMQGDSSPKQ